MEEFEAPFALHELWRKGLIVVCSMMSESIDKASKPEQNFFLICQARITLGLVRAKFVLTSRENYMAIFLKD